MLGDRLRRVASMLGCAVVCLAVSACGAKRIALPSDSGAPLDDYATIHAQVSASCRGVRTLTAELSLAGRAGDEKMRGRVLAGFARPASMRLEAVAPFGAPGFILVARGDTATLVLPRDDAVLREASAEAILGALTGVALAPADLMAILTGCVTTAPRPLAGRVHGNGLASIDLEGDATLYLRRSANDWLLHAARRGNWQIQYQSSAGRVPSVVHLVSEMPVKVDLTATLSQIETNVDLDATAFAVTVPGGARMLTIEELRASGPLRGQ